MHDESSPPPTTCGCWGGARSSCSHAGRGENKQRLLVPNRWAKCDLVLCRSLESALWLQVGGGTSEAAVSVAAGTGLPLRRTPGGCSSSSRHRRPPRLRTRRRGRRARSASCGCRSEEARAWRDTDQPDSDTGGGGQSSNLVQ